MGRATRKAHAKRTNKIAPETPRENGGPQLMIQKFPEIRDRIVAMVREGAPLNLAVINGKISYQTLYNYLNAGEEVARAIEAAVSAGLPEPELTEKQRVCLEFFDAIREAQAQRLRVDIGRISMAGRTDWRASAFRLERTHRAEFGQREPGLRITTPGGGASDGDGVQTIEFFWSDGSRDE